MRTEQIPTTTIFGFPAHLWKEVEYVDVGFNFYEAVTPATYSYHMTIWGDAGDSVAYHFDGHYLQWRRTSWDGEMSEYVAAAIVGEET